MDAARWIDSRGPARRIQRLFLAILVITLAVNALLFLSISRAWASNLYPMFLWLLLELALALAILSQLPTRVAVDGAILRVHYFGGERQVPLHEILAADLAPGDQRGLSILRLAFRRARTLALVLESPAANEVATRIERSGLFVNRNAPPRSGTPPSVSR